MTAYRSSGGSTPSTGAYSSATKAIALRPSTAPVGATRNTSSPRAVAGHLADGAGLPEQEPARAAASAAGAEIVLP